MMRRTEDKKLIFSLYGSHLKGPGQGSVLAEWWEHTEAIAERLGLKITHISGWFAEDAERIKKHKAYSMQRSRKRFAGAVSRGNARALDLDAMNSKPDGYIAFDWDFTAAFGERTDWGILSMVGIDDKYLKHLHGEELASLVGTITQDEIGRMEPLYGYCTVMPRGFLPSGYVIGLGCTGAPDNIRYDANAWMDFAERECDHSLRNIFGYNIVNAKHLDIPVGDQRLEDWIAGGSNRGHILPIGDGLFVWSFQETPEDRRFLQWDYPPVVKVREELAAYKLFPWQRLLEQ